MQIALKVLNFKKRYSTLFNIHIFKELDFKGHSKDEGVARKVTECDVCVCVCVFVCVWGGGGGWVYLFRQAAITKSIVGKTDSETAITNKNREQIL